MTSDRHYLDFYLQLRDWDSASETFKVAVLPSPAVGETREAITVKYHPSDLAPNLQKLEKREIDQVSLSQLGTQLADMLLPSGDIRDLFKNAIDCAGQDGGVRLRLVTSELKLACLPWEYCYLPLYSGADDYRHFLVLNPQISLVRHEPIGKQHPQVEGISPDEVNMLVAMANPTGNLNLAEEKQNLTAIFSDFDVDGVSFKWQPILENATALSLAKALMRKPEIFYFAGHGNFDQQGVIQLQGDTAATSYAMSATELALKLRQAGVRVAVFGACQSAQRDGISEWTGVAPTLVAEGVPVVVAMQYAVLDQQAIAFSEMFYMALAAGLSVDEAVASGRLAMLGDDAGTTRKLSVLAEDNLLQSQQPAANVQWGVPVLYMRSADSVIFPTKALYGESPPATPTAFERIQKIIIQEISSRFRSPLINFFDSEPPTAPTVAEQIQKVIKQNVDSIQNSDNFAGIKVKRVNGSIEITQN
jgi:CHAT domain